jgi:recombination protein RecR
MSYPQALEELIIEFMKYPGIGRKTAERYALFTINHIDQESLDRFSHALSAIKTKIGRCQTCGHLTETNPCSICQDPKRDGSVIMVVESPKDVFTIEKSGKYNGTYHVLHGVLSPMDGVGPEELNLSSLWPRIQRPEVHELIIATSATQEGEATAMYIQRVVKNMDLLLTRIGYGVPVGTNFEYADEKTLSKAIENRRAF